MEATNNLLGCVIYSLLCNSYLLLQVCPHLSQLEELLCGGAAEERRDLWLREDTKSQSETQQEF